MIQMSKLASFSTLVISLTLIGEVLADPTVVAHKAEIEKPHDAAEAMAGISRTKTEVRGWDHLVEVLAQRGGDPVQLARVFQDKRLPWFSDISFSPRPRESHALYRHFKNKDKISAARTFMKKWRRALAASEASYEVSAAVITSILLVETQLGKVTGDHTVLYRLARIAAVSKPENVQWNYERLRTQGEQVTLEELQNRSRYLEDTFAPEILALLEIADRNRIDIFRVKGSIAGAFGYPQFLPSSFLRFGVDADGDGRVSLFSFPDSIASVAHFLNHFGWRKGLTRAQQRAILWNYNKSDAYVDTVLDIADLLSSNKSM